MAITKEGLQKIFTHIITQKDEIDALILENTDLIAITDFLNDPEIIADYDAAMVIVNAATSG